MRLGGYAAHLPQYRVRGHLLPLRYLRLAQPAIPPHKVGRIRYLHHAAPQGIPTHRGHRAAHRRGDRLALRHRVIRAVVGAPIAQRFTVHQLVPRKRRNRLAVPRRHLPHRLRCHRRRLGRGGGFRGGFRRGCGRRCRGLRRLGDIRHRLFHGGVRLLPQGIRLLHHAGRRVGLPRQMPHNAPQRQNARRRGGKRHRQAQKIQPFFPYKRFETVHCPPSFTCRLLYAPSLRLRRAFYTRHSYPFWLRILILYNLDNLKKFLLRFVAKSCRIKCCSFWNCF